MSEALAEERFVWDMYNPSTQEWEPFARSEREEKRKAFYACDK